MDIIAARTEIFLDEAGLTVRTGIVLLVVLPTTALVVGVAFDKLKVAGGGREEGNGERE
jgi:hypothetical protein